MNGKLQGHWSVWMPVYPWTVKVQPSGLIRSQSSQISQVYILLKTVTVSSGSTPTCSFVHYKQKDMGKKKKTPTGAGKRLTWQSDSSPHKQKDLSSNSTIKPRTYHSKPSMVVCAYILRAREADRQIPVLTGQPA